MKSAREQWKSIRDSILKDQIFATVSDDQARMIFLAGVFSMAAEFIVALKDANISSVRMHEWLQSLRSELDEFYEGIPG